MSTYILAVQESYQSTIVEAPVVSLGDDRLAVTWVKKCEGTRFPRAAFLIRYLSAFLGGLAKICFREYLLSTRMRVGRRRNWGRVVKRRVQWFCGPNADGRCGSFHKRYF